MKNLIRQIVPIFLLMVTLCSCASNVTEAEKRLFKHENEEMDELSRFFSMNKFDRIDFWIFPVGRTEVRRLQLNLSLEIIIGSRSFLKRIIETLEWKISMKQNRVSMIDRSWYKLLEALKQELSIWRRER